MQLENKIRMHLKGLGDLHSRSFDSVTHHVTSLAPHLERLQWNTALMVAFGFWSV